MTGPYSELWLQERISLRELSLAFEVLPVAISWAKIESQSVLFANRAFLDMFGHEPGQFATLEAWVEATYPFVEDRVIARTRWGAFLGTSGASSAVDPVVIQAVELRILCQDGAIKSVSHGGVTFPGGGWGFATFTEVTGRRSVDRTEALGAEEACDVAGRVDDQAASAGRSDDMAAPQQSSWETRSAERQREALRLDAEMLDRTGRLAGVGGWEVDLIHGASSWTAEAHRILGIATGFEPTLEEGIKFYAPEAKHLMRNVMETAINSGTDWDVEAPMVRGDGKRIWVRTRGSVEMLEGKPVRLIGAIQDITARVLEQNATRKANERLVLATASGHIGTWDWDMVHEAAFWDDRMYGLFGLDPAERNASYETWQERLHPDDAVRAEREMQTALNSALPYESEYRVIWKDGTIHHIRAMGQAEHNAEGLPARMVGVNWDVTENRRLAAERAKHDELFRVTLESIGDGVVTTDAGARVQWMNPVAERLTGWKTAEAAGVGLSEIFRLVDEDTREAVVDPVVGCLDQERVMGSKNLLLSRDGHEIGIDHSAAPICDGRRQMLGVVLVFRDVTEQRRLVREAARMLKLDLQMKDAFLSHVSHELRSPLASIYSFATIIVDGLAGEVQPPQDEYLGIIVKNARQLRSMIDDLLEVSRSEAGKLGIVAEAVSLHEAASDAVNTIRVQAEAKGIDLRLNWQVDLPRVFADATRLRQILIIILDNAIKFTPAGGAVVVAGSRFAEAEGFLQVCIADTGCGMEQEDTERVFEQLYQVAQPALEGRKGLGLGLYIARDLVTRQGGEIWVKSEPGRGSTFCFTVPAWRSGMDAAPYPAWGTERRKKA